MTEALCKKGNEEAFWNLIQGYLPLDWDKSWKLWKFRQKNFIEDIINKNRTSKKND